MTIYIVLVIAIILGQLMQSQRLISKKTYITLICIMMIFISGFRSVEVGMWDTSTVYLPSFNVVNTHSIPELLQMDDSQYKFIGFVIYSKIIGLISKSNWFYILMMAWPFYVAVSILIYKYSETPIYSFVALLAMGYFTYSFSMIRGMLALAALCIALDAALEENWKKFFLWVLIGTSFHVTALIFLLIPFIRKIKWNLKKMMLTFLAFAGLRGILPSLWSLFVNNVISGILPTYHYYGNKEGVLAIGMLIIYISLNIVIMLETWLANGSAVSTVIVIKRPTFRKIHKEKTVYIEDSRINMLIGLSVIATILMLMTGILSEMVRIAMLMGLGSVVIVGKSFVQNTERNYKFVVLTKLCLLALMLYYFYTSALPNMNALPYSFIWS